MTFLAIRVWFAKIFGKKIEFTGPVVFGVGYKLGRTIYFEKVKR